MRRRLTDSRHSCTSYRFSLSGRKGKWRTALRSTPTSHVSLVEPIQLPPPFTLVRLRESGDAFAHACGIAPKRGAGTLVCVGRFDLAEFAVVLEPGELLSTARRAFYAGMVALTDALREYAPPNKTVAIGWPGSVEIDGGLVGGGRMGWPSSAREDEPPAWLVFGAMIRTVAMADRGPGVQVLASALDEEGFGEAGAAQVTESFARHLMRVIDRWQVDGFDSVARDYLSRVPRERRTVLSIDESGDLLTRRVDTGKVERSDLVKALAKPSWLDPKLGGPRL
ncbi:biotin/lipoate--protein ligase family protein [Bradyrhizobium sp. CCBAU 11361]|uniref:biotin/lipoate--protein ligase family protein n=1 Tax=Bradyrhizobium sp. CCBAU 11361 TaxID=1630812 RepID=UPI0023044F2A|nr:biotin/lipoate--protein ligase family protein [Bradyrhizobium sp. CCBAU 11361]